MVDQWLIMVNNLLHISWPTLVIVPSNTLSICPINLWVLMANNDDDGQ